MRAISETNRRRAIQQKYNEEHGITPKTIKKAVRSVFDIVSDSGKTSGKASAGSSGVDVVKLINEGEASGSKEDISKLIEKLTSEMTKAAKDLDFERAAEIRDIIIELKGNKK